MKKEILFKGKRINYEKFPKEEWWIEGNAFIHNDGQTVDIATGTEKFSINKKIIPETLCQYIGMRDKNGNRIWENDICEVVDDGQVYVYVIVWDKEELDFKGTNGKEKYGSDFVYLRCCEEIVRIGNVFDNPELLKGE